MESSQSRDQTLGPCIGRQILFFFFLAGRFLTTEPLRKSQHLPYSLPSQASRPFPPSVDGLISYPIEKAACSPTYQNLSHICSLAFLTEKGQHFLLLFFFFFFVGGILVLWPVMEPVASALKVQSPNHWTTGKFPSSAFPEGDRASHPCH